MMNGRRITPRIILSLIFPLFVINGLLSLFRVLPEQRYFLLLLPGLETIITALVLHAGSRRARLTSSILVLPLTVLVLVGLGETFFRFVYRASFSVWRDLPFAPSFFNMVFETDIFEKPAVAAAAAVLTAVVFGTILWRLMEKYSLAARRTGSSAALILVMLGCVRVFAAPPLSPLSAAVGSALLLPRNEASTDSAVRSGSEVPDGQAAGMVKKIRTPGDVTFFIVESYGHTLFSRSDHYGRIKPVYDRLQRRLDETGFRAASHFMRSPAFGGRSWLADGTILSGRWLGDQAAYEDLLQSGAYTMVKYFRDLGYRTVMAAPAMTYVEKGWPSVYPFDELYINRQLGYKGPAFDFGYLPDQYLLWELSRIRRRNTDHRPVFSAAVMVSSHVPFRQVPPYIDDWQSIGDGSVYAGLTRRRFDNDWLSGGEYPEGYTSSIEYVLRTAVEYAVKFGGPDELFVIIGDHQPRIPISERESTFSVPVHVLSHAAELVDRFLPFGFSVGLEPVQKEPHPRMDRVFSLLRSQFEYLQPVFHSLQR